MNKGLLSNFIVLTAIFTALTEVGTLISSGIYSFKEEFLWNLWISIGLAVLMVIIIYIQKKVNKFSENNPKTFKLLFYFGVIGAFIVIGIIIYLIYDFITILKMADSW